MNESILLKLSLATSLIGLVALFLILNFSEIEEIPIILLSDGDLSSTIKVSGRIEQISTVSNLTFISINQSALIDAVVFEELNISKDSSVELIGTLDKYNGKKELIVEKIIEN